MGKRDSKTKRYENGGSGDGPADPPPVLLPIATVLDCDLDWAGNRLLQQQATARKDGAHPIEEYATLTLGLADGQVVGGRLSRAELSFLTGRVLHVLMLVGDQAAVAAGRAYVTAVELIHGRRRRFKAPGAPALEPDGMELRERARRAPKQHRRKRPEKPFARASGRFLKVRFHNEPGHRRIAIVAGFQVEGPRRNGMLLLLRWRVSSGKRSRFRDFFVLLPGADRKSREVLYLARKPGTMQINQPQWQALSELEYDKRVELFGLTLRRLHVGDVIERTSLIYYLANCDAAEWEKGGEEDHRA